MGTILTYEKNNETVNLFISDPNVVEITRYNRTIDQPTTTVAKFRLDELWDLLKDELSIMELDPLKSPGLHRRQGEALSARLYTNKLYGR